MSASSGRDRSRDPFGGPYVGIMSGTSLDGADAVLVAFDQDRPRLIATASAPFDDTLRAELLALQKSGADELHRAALAAQAMVDLHARLALAVCRDGGIDPRDVVAIGSHGQTVRHRPERGYTIQLNAPARLAEATGITVVADFRSRDVAAGGQGAPLVPAFHDALFRLPDRHRVVLNLGGMSNVTDLPCDPAQPVRGWDCGPGNVLLDGWIAEHRGTTFDRDGAWAGEGQVHEALLDALEAEPWFALPPPKSTGRDLFDRAWLLARLAPFDGVAPVDVQTTLATLTAKTIAHSVLTHAGRPDELIVCGGGAYNEDLLLRLRAAFCDDVAILPSSDPAAGGVAPEHVEALAFAWLAMRCMTDRPGNLPAVTGAAGLRVLGAIHPR
jgi:anhydro-N-acetylmuramic acid kinase